MKKLAVLILLFLLPVKGLASEQLSSLPIFLYEEKMEEEDIKALQEILEITDVEKTTIPIDLQKYLNTKDKKIKIGMFIKENAKGSGVEIRNFTPDTIPDKSILQIKDSLDEMGIKNGTIFIASLNPLEDTGLGKKGIALLSMLLSGEERISYIKEIIQPKNIERYGKEKFNALLETLSEEWDKVVNGDDNSKEWKEKIEQSLNKIGIDTDWDMESENDIQEKDRENEKETNSNKNKLKKIWDVIKSYGKNLWNFFKNL